MADGIGEFLRSITGDNTVINAVVYNQGQGEYVAVPIDLTAEQVADFKADPSLSGRELSSDKLNDVIDDVNPNQVYYGFDDISEAMVGRFNDTIRDVVMTMAHIDADLTDKDAFDTSYAAVEVYDTNGINAALQSIDFALQDKISEAVSYGYGDTEAVQRGRELLEEIGGTHALAQTANEIWFQNDKVPAPGMEYQEPDYDQFRSAASEGTAPTLEPVLPE